MCPRRLILRAAAGFVLAALTRLTHVAMLSLNWSKSNQIILRLAFESARPNRTSSESGRATRRVYALPQSLIQRENLSLLVVYGECELNSFGRFAWPSARRVLR